MNSFSDICRGRYFVVPENQRGYSWNRKQIQDIFDDLRLAGAHAHYMGPVIVSRTETPDFQDAELNTMVEFCLEDGQQRLTTLMLIANRIRRHLIDSLQGEDLDTRELDRLLFYNHNGLKLRLQNRNPDLKQHFEHVLRGQPAPPARRTPPMRALEQADRVISQWLEENATTVQELKRWKQRLLNQAKFIWVDLASEGINRYLAFDAINSRGLALSEFDKIKNFCILVAECRHIQALHVEDEWYSAIASLEAYQAASRAEEAAYISEYFGSFFDYRVGQDAVHAEFVKRFRRLLTEEDQALEDELVKFIRGWNGYAESFGFLISKNRTSYYGDKCDPAAGPWLDRLHNMDLPTITRPILAACHLRLPRDVFPVLVRACEIYTFRVYAAIRFRKDRNAAAIVTLSHNVLRHGGRADDVLTSICAWLVKMAPMKAFIGALADGKTKYAYDPDTRGWPACYYFLYEYEIGRSALGVQPLPWQESRDGKINTQEHILPQGHRDGGWWQAHWPNEARANAFRHRLGNLVLTTNNGVLGRKEFRLKLIDPNAAHYYTHPNATCSEKEIDQFTAGFEWEEQNILRREAAIIDWAAQRWSLPCCNDNGSYQLPIDFECVEEAERTIVVNHADCIPTGLAVENQIENDEAEEEYNGEPVVVDDGLI